MMFPSDKKYTKFFASVLIAVIGVSELIGLFAPQAASAQWLVEDPGAISLLAQQVASKVTEKTQTTLENALRISALTSLMNGVTYFVRKLAYDTATYIASGGPGQGSLIDQKPFGQYIADTLGDSAGEAIGDLGKPFGLNLCQLPDLNVQVFLQIGLRNLYGIGSPQPSCQWQTFKDNILNPAAYAKKYGDPKYLAEHFSANLSVQNSDFGIAMGAVARVEGIQAAATEAAKNQRLEGNGVKPLTDLITKQITTPAELVQQDLNHLSAKEQQDMSLSQLAGLYGDASPQLLLTAGNVFLNTLANQLLKKLLTQGLFPASGGSTSGVADFFGIAQNNRQAVQQVFATLFTPAVEPLPTYSAVNDFSTCPDAPTVPGLNNCVMDKDLRAAVDRATKGDAPLTIAEALSANPPLLHGDWQLIPPTDEVKNTDRNCYKEGYCYSNIQKLRKARILPLGMEIAAQQADPAKPPTLLDVVNGFDNCPADGQPNPQYPYCHLVNPNWVLKAPEEMCRMYAYGPELVDPQTPDRRQECMDLATCVLEDANGKCIDNKFGYCTQEKNVWRLGGSTCPAQFNTCKTVSNAESGQVVSYLSKTLDYGECSANTVGCKAYSTTQNSAGAWLVSTTTISTVDRQSGHTAALYFNKNSQTTDATCPSSSDGCTAFYPAIKNDDGTYPLDAVSHTFMEATSTAGDNLVHLKKAPDYLGCYDTDRATAAIDWPTTVAEANTLAGQAPAACHAYANVCTQSEVGCESFTPLTGGSTVAIPGVIGANRCDASCAGYDTFRQEATKFDAAKFPLYFIPPSASTVSNAKTCSAQYVGCDEFTNIDAQAKGGEGLEYYTSLRYCEKPTGSNEQTYYSWEGTNDQGFVLRTHVLLPVSAQEQSYLTSIRPSLTTNSGSQDITQSVNDVFPVNSPAYDDDTKSSVEAYYARCNATLYNNRILTNGTGEITDAAGTRQIPYASDLNCQALYDDQGAIFYRLISNTVTVDAACHLLRKSVPNLVIDTAIIDDVTCTSKQGVWDTVAKTCQRCAGGGRFIPSGTGVDGGFCQYQTISAPGESESCPAEFNGCRAYVGNTGNNRRIVFTDTFEPVGTGVNALQAANPGWDDLSNAHRGAPTSTGITVSSEALRVSEHSLFVHLSSRTSAASRFLAPRTLTAGQSYELTFWARSTGSDTLAVHFEQPAATGFAGGVMGDFTHDAGRNLDTPVSIGNAWQQYHVGPVSFASAAGVTGSSTLPTYLVFASGAQTNYFIDNVELTELQDHSYIIKNSWQVTVGSCSDDAQHFCSTNADCSTGATCLMNTVADVPLTCDANPIDAVPGAALGCTGYKDSKGVTAYTTGFDSLCRPEAVGCRPLWDTHNTVDATYDADGGQYLQAYNLWCDNTDGTLSATHDKCTLHVGLKSMSGPETGDCAILQGQTGCYVPDRLIFPTTTPSALLGIHSPSDAPGTSSAVVIPADTPANAPIYLADQPNVECPTKDVGCMMLGRETPTLPDGGGYTYDSVFVKNNPNLYSQPDGSGMLCRPAVVGCTEFDVAGGGATYAKDPALSGGGTCSYRENVTINGTSYNGWFRDGVGRCSNNNTILCRDASVCGTGNTCTDVGAVPCYDHYITRSGGAIIYDIHANLDAGYTGAVGQCPATQNACTEFIDPSDTSNLYPHGHPYYALFNDQIKSKINECRGQVSQTAGCVLFDQTENPTKTYNSAATYTRSHDATPPYALVDASQSASSQDNDTNIILKVDRDRTCSQWLSCKSSTTEVGPDGRPHTLCSDYKLCDATSAGSADCTHWVSDQASPIVGRLTEDTYIDRDTSWQGVDYSGYSLYNKYQIGTLTTVKFDLTDYQRLMDLGYGDTSFLAYHLDTADDVCATSGADKTWSGCGPSGLSIGRCYGGQCLVPVNGAIPDSAGIPSPIHPRVPGTGSDNRVKDIQNILGYFTGGTCKAYPEKDSPFPRSIAISTNPPFNFSEKKELFAGANVCQSGNGSAGDCSCQYQKVSYRGAAPLYWPIRLPAGASIPNGICSGGADDGKSCSTAADCAASPDSAVMPVCNPKIKQVKNFGVTGYCLEYDLSHPINGAADFSKKEIQQYACLTWLPIDVSASNANFFNTALSAGYDPELDAESTSAGAVVCSQVDNGGYYDPNLLTLARDPSNPTNPSDLERINSNGFSQLYNENWLPKNYDSSQHPDWHPPAIVDNQRCNEGSGVSAGSILSAALGFLVCGPPCAAVGAGTGNVAQTITTDFLYGTLQPNQTVLFTLSCNEENPGANSVHIAKKVGLYRLLTYWAWKNVSTDSVVLRLEIGGDSKIRESGNVLGVQDNDQVVENDNGVYPPASPDFNHQLAPMRFAYNGLPDANGVPNRLNSATTRHAADEDHLDVYSSPLVSLTANGTQGLYDTSLDKVYFVPIRYRDTTRGFVPPLLTKDLAIDFSQLRASGSSIVTPVASEYIAAKQRFDMYDNDYTGYNHIISFPMHIATSHGSEWIFDRTPSDAQDVYVWNFMVDRSDTSRDYSALFAADNAPGSPFVAPVQRKYVMVFFPDRHQGLDLTYDSNHHFIDNSLPNFIQNLVNPPDTINQYLSTHNNTLPIPTVAAQDPFSNSVDCQTGTDGQSHHENWFAVAMNFDVHGKFLGYTSRWCLGYSNQEAVRAGINLAVVANLSNQCVEYAQVYNQSNEGINTTNKAWTNRVWSSATNNDVGGPFRHPSAAYSNGFNVSTRNKPFGLASLDSSLLNNLESPNTTIVDGQQTPKQWGLLSYSFQDDTSVINNGVPYSCRGSLYTNTSLSRLAQNIIRACAFDVDSVYNTTQSNVLASADLTTANAAIHELFAARYNIADLDLVNRRFYTYAQVSTDDRSGNLTRDNTTNQTLLPPQIYSLNPARCRTGNSQLTGNNQSCTAGEANNITINGHNSTVTNYDGRDPVRDEDLNFDGNPDPIIAVGTYSAQAEFFAWVDDNRMPIRSVTMVWGDGNSVSHNADGWYKNRKPFCSTGDAATPISVGLCSTDGVVFSGLTCQTQSDCPVGSGQNCYFKDTVSPQYQVSRFGNATRACDTGRRFQFSHNYTCNSFDAQSWTDLDHPSYAYRVRDLVHGINNTNTDLDDARTRLLSSAYGLTNTSWVCVFKPRVQVKDNWGYCNGVESDGVTPLTAGYYNDGQFHPCTDVINLASTPFKGNIIVIPSN